MKKMQEWIMWAFLAITPICYNLQTLDQRGFQELFFKFAAMILIVTFCKNIWLILFFYLGVILWIFNNCEVGHVVLLNIFLGIVLFTCSKAYFKTHDFLKTVRILLIPLFLSILFMIFQRFAIDPLHVNNPLQGDTVFRDFTDVIGLFGSKTHNAIFMAIMIPIIAAWRWWAGPILFIPMLFCESSAAIGAGVVAYLLVIFFHHRKRAIILVPVLLIAALIYAGAERTGSSLTNRFPMWHATFKMACERPIGYGPASFNSITPHKKYKFFTNDDGKLLIGHYIGTHDGMEDYDVKLYNPNFYKMHKENPITNITRPVSWNNPHNLFLDVFFEFGIVGVLLLILLICEIIQRFIRSDKPIEVTVLFAILMVYLISSTMQFPLYVARLACLAPIFLGAFYSRTETEKT